MNLYEIDEALYNAIEYCVDEDGVILEGDELRQKLDTLEMVLEDKITNIACYIKNLKADYKALKLEKENFDKRMKAKKARYEGLERYLSNFLLAKDMRKFENNKVKIGFRKSTTCVVDEGVNVYSDKVPEEYVKTKIDTSIDKEKLKKYLTQLKSEDKENPFDWCRLVENENIGIK